MSNYIEERPWGKFEILHEGKTSKVKEITVNPGQKLSYQSHEKRNEKWTITQGVGIVTLDGKEQEIKEGDVIRIPAKMKHRIQNTSEDIDLKFIEIQTGRYFGEDDIIRYEDDYGRK
jgi:mannose-6-phosphate isomerase-like protein (cupin superfamily)